MERELTELNQKIQACQKCSGIQVPLLKTAVTHRGQKSRVMLIGRNPGSKEIATEHPFSGISGRRLNQWLTDCGNPTDEPRRGTYLTSIIKCFCGTNKAQLSAMAENCHAILEEQISLIQPELIITLGEDAYRQLSFVNLSFAQALFQTFNSRNEVLFTKFNHHFIHLAWPHPSPLSRILNDAIQRARMSASFEAVKPFLIEVA